MRSRFANDSPSQLQLNVIVCFVKCLNSSLFISCSIFSLTARLASLTSSKSNRFFLPSRDCWRPKLLSASIVLYVSANTLCRLIRCIANGVPVAYYNKRSNKAQVVAVPRVIEVPIRIAKGAPIKFKVEKGRKQNIFAKMNNLLSHKN